MSVGNTHAHVVINYDRVHIKIPPSPGDFDGCGVVIEISHTDLVRALMPLITMHLAMDDASTQYLAERLLPHLAPRMGAAMLENANGNRD